MKLIVSETFYSLQGEGNTMGYPSVFLRLGGCNLLCKGSGWVCDTIEVWSKSKAIPFEDVLTPEHIQRLKAGAHLVITGGEPLLHQKQLAEYLFWMWELHKFYPFIEVETNGTIIPENDFAQYVQQWNCSPKLSNSGELFERRFNPIALDAIEKSEASKCFKFVIANEGDMLEVFQDFGFLDVRNFILMPAGDSQELLNLTRPIVAELCIRSGTRYCDRLHVTIWNKKTGV